MAASEVKYVKDTARLIRTTVGMVLFEQGDTPSMLYLVHSGLYRATVSSDGLRTSTLAASSFGRSSAFGTNSDGNRPARDFGPLDNFGACELLSTMGDRTHTVTCLEAGWVWGIPQRLVASKLKIPPPKASNVGLIDLFQDCKLFKGISRERLIQLSRGAEVVEYKPHEQVFEEGSQAEEIFVVKSGSVVTSQAGSDYRLKLVYKEAFGETSLFPDEDMRTRITGAHAAEGTGCKLVKIKSSAVETFLGFELQQAAIPFVHRRLLSMTTCAKRSLALGLRKDEMEALLGVMEERAWEPKDVVAPEGEMDESMFLIKRGHAIVKRGERGELATLKRGDCFGEQALVPAEVLKKGKRRGSVIASGTDNLVTLSLSADSLQALRDLDPMAGFPSLAEKSLTDDSLDGMGLNGWADRLLNDITESAIVGIDSAVVAYIEESGGNLASLIPPNTKKYSKGKTGKGGDAVKSGTAGSSAEKKGRGEKRRPSIIQRIRRASFASKEPAEPAAGDADDSLLAIDAAGPSDKPAKPARRASIIDRLRGKA